MEDIVHDPFLRQIKDYHRFSAGQNVWVYGQIALDELDITRLREACVKLLTRRSILRTVLFKDPKGVIQCRILPVDDPKFDIDLRCGVRYEDAFAMHEIVKDYADTPVSAGPLFKLIVYRTAISWIVLLHVHHIICEAASLMILKQELSELYNNQVPAVEKVFQFSDYSRYRNNRLIESFEKDISFYVKTGLPVSVKASGKKRSLEEVLKELSDPAGFVFDHSLQCPANYYQTVYRIDNFEGLQKAIQHDGIRWNSLIMGCASFVINQLYPEKRGLIGFLFNDRTSKYSINNIGEFTGECFFDTSDYDTISREKLKKVNLYLYEIYRHLIFNYRFYSIDENILFGGLCRMFINFYFEREDFVPGAAQLNSFVETRPIACDLQPTIVLHPNGYMAFHWNFKTKVFTGSEMSDVNDLFISAFRQIEALYGQ